MSNTTSIQDRINKLKEDENSNLIKLHSALAEDIRISQSIVDNMKYKVEAQIMKIRKEAEEEINELTQSIQESQDMCDDIRTMYIIKEIYKNAIDELGAENAPPNLYETLLDNITSKFEVSQCDDRSDGCYEYYTTIIYYWKGLRAKIQYTHGEAYNNRGADDYVRGSLVNDKGVIVKSFTDRYRWSLDNLCRVKSWEELSEYNECFMAGILYNMYYNTINRYTCKGGSDYASYDCDKYEIHDSDEESDNDD